MFSLAVLALASIASSANALVIPRDSTIPATYAQGYLENYHVYHTRYLALDCEAQHNTTFFDDCCHPLLATENLQDNRKAYCTPSESASSSAALAEPTSTVVPSGDDDCDDDEDSSTADPAPTAAAPPPENVAPAPSSAPSPSPSPSPSPKPSPTTSSAKASSSSSSSSGGLSGIVGNIFSGGIATFFFQNGVAGNCGTVHQDSDHVVALQTDTYANGAHCGKTIQIKDTKTGHTTTGVVADSCPTCQDPQSIDLSQGLFDEFASAADGIFNVEWGFLE